MRKRYSRSYTVLSFLTMFSYREQPSAAPCYTFPLYTHSGKWQGKEAAAGIACGRFMFAINYRAFFAVSTRILNASGSVMASSDRALRFISMPDFFRPYMKRE